MALVIFEGLPGSGKTTITTYLSKKYHFCVRIGEVIDYRGNEIPIEKHRGKRWDFFTRSDKNKIKLWRSKLKNKIVLLDRGYVSTISHGFAREFVEKISPLNKIIQDFKKKLDLKESDIYYVYLDNDIKTSLKRDKHSPEDIWGKRPQLEATRLFYEIFFLFRKNVYNIKSNKLSLQGCKKICDKIILEIKKKSKNIN